MSDDANKDQASFRQQVKNATADEREAPLTERRYAVGYGKPPKASRFRPGQSGNQKGRPRGTLNISTIIDIESSMKVPINDGGHRRSLSKTQIGLRQLFNKAAGGDGKAIAAVIDLLRKSGKINDTPLPQAPTLDARDQATAEKLLAFFESATTDFENGGEKT